MPVFLFALSQAESVHWKNALYLFVILHLLVYPSSNGYNSYMDRDVTPIGGLKNPLQPTRQLFYISVAMDILALLFSFLIHPYLSLGILFYILASRAYSYRGIRLKKYPYIGFATVFVFQGAYIFLLTYLTCATEVHTKLLFIQGLAASLLIGALYPLTQIYQHREDQMDGVITISYKLGYRGTFIFSAILFMAAAACLYLIFRQQNRLNLFYFFLLYTAPVVLFFCYWLYKVWRHKNEANFKNSFWMNIIATTCTTAFFTTLIVKHFE